MDRILKYGLMLIVLSLSACNGQISNPITSEHRARAEETFNATTFTTSLEQILLWHQTNNTEVVSALNPGIDEAALREKFADLSCRPPEELIELWAWHNGVNDSAHPFIWYHNFLSVEAAIAEYESLMANPLIGWPADWIPIFEFEGEWYFVECYEEPRKASPVGYFFLEDPDAIYAYVNLTKMLETSAIWFNQSAVIWDNDQQGMNEDLKALFEIHQALNEGARFPYSVSQTYPAAE